MDREELLKHFGEKKVEAILLARKPKPRPRSKKGAPAKKAIRKKA